MKASVKLSREDLLKAEKTRRRLEIIEAGAYNIFKNQTFKDKKAYSRKSKHKMDF